MGVFGEQHEHLGLQKHEDGYYCKCLPGYIGHECGIQVDDCDGDSGYNPSDPTGVMKSCYHGSKCHSDGNGSWYCDCKALNEDSGPTATKFAGMMCQHQSTGLCAASLAGSFSGGRTNAYSAPNHQFCTNHGKCVKMVALGEAHPGCVCREGWAGDHCEIQQDQLTPLQTSEGGGNSVAGKVLFSLMLIAMIAVASGIAILLVRARKREGDESGVADSGKEVKKADVEPDGSGTLGTSSEGNSSTEESNENGDGDMELTLNEEADEPEIV